MGSLLLLVAALAAPPTAPCRALVNVQAAQAPVGAGYQVHDLRFGAGAPAVTTRRGLATGVGRDVSRLRVLPDGESAAHGWGTDAALQLLHHGVGVTLLQADSGFSGDADGAPEGMTLQGEGTLSGLSVLGPWLGVFHVTYGYGGGAHDYHGEDWQLLRPPAKKAVDPTGLFLEVERVAQAAHAKAKASVEYDPPEITAKTLAEAGLRAQGATLEVVDSLYCCSWAENHNLYALAHPVTPAPALASVLPDAQGVFHGPKGCTLRIDGQAAQVAQGGAAQAVPLAGRLVGVAWIDPSTPPLAPWPADVEGARAALAKAAKASAEHGEARWALARRAATLAPEDGAILLEAGWLGFRVKGAGKGQQAEAQALTERALAHTDAEADPVQAAKAHYNLGRFLEAAGRTAEARQHYTRSLALRPHPVVKKRLADLPK